MGQGRSIAFVGVGDPVNLWGNGPAIEDAIRNFIENAVAHFPEGQEVTVTVGADCGVQVADHGPGVPPEEREHIFERFWRGRGPRGQGAGLGLGIVKEIMRAHHGTVAVSNGDGALFTMQFSHAADKARPTEALNP